MLSLTYSHVIPFAMCRFIHSPGWLVACSCSCSGSVYLSQHFTNRKHFEHNCHIASPFRLYLHLSTHPLDVTDKLQGNRLRNKKCQLLFPLFSYTKIEEDFLSWLDKFFANMNRTNGTIVHPVKKTAQTYFYDRRLGYFSSLFFSFSPLSLFLYIQKMPVAAFPITWNHFKCLIWKFSI